MGVENFIRFTVSYGRSKLVQKGQISPICLYCRYEYNIQKLGYCACHKMKDLQEEVQTIGWLSGWMSF
jgi:hypothetical protein